MGYAKERYWVNKTLLTKEITADGADYIVIPEDAVILRLDVLITRAAAANNSTATLYDAYSGGNTLASITINTTDLAGTIKSTTSIAPDYKNITGPKVLRVYLDDAGTSPTLKGIAFITYRSRYS
jgi:hypothetical protein